MELSEIIPHIEALIFASDRPLTSLDLVDLINNAFGFMEQQITLDQVETALEGIREKYNSDFYPFEVFQSGGGWQFLSKPAFHTTIAQLNSGKFLKKLSNAALETLSIIAYKQPITKGEIESIRGVNSDYSVQKLLEKELIIISGRSEDLPGKPLIYETSKSFMDYFGLNSASDLPKIKEVLAEQIEPTSQQRNTEENLDFGIFSKFNQDKDKAGENGEQPTADENTQSVTPDADTESLMEMELADTEQRESLQEATEDLDQELHPDLAILDMESASQPPSDEAAIIANAEESETESDADADIDTDSDIEDEELASLEAEEEGHNSDADEVEEKVEDSEIVDDEEEEDEDEDDEDGDDEDGDDEEDEDGDEDGEDGDEDGDEDGEEEDEDEDEDDEDEDDDDNEEDGDEDKTYKHSSI